jgi:hypothetical protein
MQEVGERAEAIASIAEGETLPALVVITKAYSATDGPAMLLRMLRTARWPSRLALIVSILLTFAMIACRIEQGIHISAVALVTSVYLFRLDAFRIYSKKKSTTFLNTFSRRDQAIRYIIFREQVPAEITRNAAILDRLRALLDQRQKVRRAGLVTRHPLVTAFIALFLMLVSVQSGTPFR